jgi:hypothetical protein
MAVIVTTRLWRLYYTRVLLILFYRPARHVKMADGISYRFSYVVHYWLQAELPIDVRHALHC